MRKQADKLLQKPFLYVVPTPIGNLDDFTFRAVKVLNSVDVVVCEDTRKTKLLFTHYNIKPKFLIVQNEHNEKQVVPRIILELKKGKSVALVTDAGMPLISDPGYPLIVAALKEDISVVPLPGPSALLPALVGSGLSCDRFLFVGFLPRKKGRKTRFLQLQRIASVGLGLTFVFYEAPHRLVKFFSELQIFFGEAVEVCIAKELTKVYEEFIRGSLKDVQACIKSNLKKIRGEFVILVSVPKKFKPPLK